jgi:hypothetical protein
MTPFFLRPDVGSNLAIPNAIIKIFLFVLPVCLTCTVFAQGPNWLSGTAYPTSPDRQEDSEFVLATSDGGSLLVGSFEYGAGDWDGRIVKLNGNGTKLWEAKPGGAGLDYLYSACEFSDGYIVVGKKTVNGNFRMWALKYNLTGGFLWEQALTSNYTGNSFGGMTVIKSLGNRAIIGGYRAGFTVPQPFPTPPSSAGHLWVLEPSNGAVFQDKPTDGYITYKMELKPDQSGYYAFGETFDISEEGCGGNWKDGSFSPTGPNSGYYSDIIVSTLDLSTNLLDSWTYGGETNDIFIDAMATADNGFAILARTACLANSGNTGPNNVGLDEWLLKGSEFGDLEWVQSVGLNIIDAVIIPFGLTGSCDDKIVLGSDGGFYSPTPSNIIIDKYDLNGTPMWSEFQGFTDPFFTSSYITTTASGAYLIMSDASSPNNDEDFYLHRWSVDPACSPNDFCSKAVTVSCGQYLANQTTVGAGNSITNYPCINGTAFTGADKVYKITLNQTSDLQVGLEILQANLDLDLFLLSNNCTTVTCLDWSTKPNVPSPNYLTTNLEGIAKSLSAGTYYIVVDGYNAAQQGSFNIDFACGKLNCASVTSLVCGTPYSSNTASGSNNVSIYNLTAGLEDDLPAAPNDPAKLLDVNNAGPERIHQFTINQQSSVSITLTGVSPNIDLELFLLNSNCIGKTCIAKSVLPAGQNESIIVTLNPGTYYVVVDGFQNYSGAYTLTVNCGNCPPPVNNFNCDVVKCYYSGDGSNLQYTFTANQAIAPGYNWKITGNNVNFTGGTGINQTYNFINPGTYQICYPYLNFDGCVEYCCINLCVLNPFDCDGSIAPAFDANVNGWRFRLQGTASNIEWRDDNTGQFLGNNVLSNLIPVPNPCNSGISKTVSVSYFDGNCYRVCCFSYYPCNPFDCGFITYAYDANANGYRFELNTIGGFDQNTITWTVDSPVNQSLGTGSFQSNLLPLPVNCTEYWVSVRFKDAFGIWKVCCIKIYICNPFNCFDFVYNYVPASSGYQFVLNQNGATNISWTLDDNGSSLGTGATSSILPIPGNCVQRTVTVRYYWNGVWYICCRTMWLCNTAFNCFDFVYNYVPANGGYQFVLNQNGATNISWTLDDNGSSLGNGATSSVLPIPPGNCIQRTVTVRYFWNGAWYICCRKLWLCNNPFDCIDFGYNYVPTSSGYQFVLNQNGATNITWTLDDNGSSLGTGSSSSILPIPPGNCIERTVTVRYFWNGAWYICCRKLWLCNNPFDCLTFDYNYVPASNGYQFVLNQNGATNISWILDDTGASLGTGSSSSVLPIPPGNCIQRTVTVRYFWNGAWYICCRKMILCNNPLSCLDFAYNYVPANNGYQFVLNQNGATNISWTLDDTGASIGTGATSSILPIPGNCDDVTITVRYFWNGVWYICCRKIWLCNPNSCATEITHSWQNTNLLTLSTNPGYQSVVWRLENGVVLGTGNNISITNPGPNAIVCVYYLDLGNIWRVCCKSIGVPPNPATDLTFDIDDNICASSNTIVDIPIRVRNFNNVLSFEMSVKSLNGSLAQIVSINPGVLNGSGFFQVLDPTTGVLSWFNATPVTVADNSIACTLRVNLSGNAGASGIIDFANTPTAINAEQIVNGSQTPVTPLLIGGSACIISNITIAGKITREDNVGVGNATVQLTGSSNQTTTTDAQGNYAFNAVTAGGNYIITPVKDIGDKNGVTGGDLVAIQRHILSITPLASPYKRIAADANNTQSISGGDLVSIQRLILSLDPTLLANQSWRFVEKSWVFSNPANPWTTPFPERITLNNASNNVSNADFTGIKIADANLSNNPNTFGHQNVDYRDASMVLETKYHLAEQNRKVYYPVSVAADCDLESIQFTLVYDHDALTFKGANSNVLPGFSDNNYGLPMKDQGIVTIVWATTSGDPIQLKEGEEILWLEFDYQDNNLMPQDYDLKLLSDPTEAIATTLGGSSKQLELRNLSHASNHFSHRAYPNPFSNKGVLLIELPNEDDLDIAVYNSNGQRVFINTGHFNAGVHAVSFECAGCTDTQMLYYQIRGAHFTGSGKVMFVKQ